MFSVGCVFIDRASDYVSIKNQVPINSTETVKEKLTYDKEAQIQGVLIKRYYTYNRIFNASEFMKEPLNNHKKIKFSGSGASHQNRAE